jgi:uncharacterized membrane protein
MKTKLALKVVGLIGVLALISVGYCFWLMTVPLSYNLVYVVVAGFLVSLIVFVVALISLVIIAIRLGRSSRASRSPETIPP